MYHSMYTVINVVKGRGGRVWGRANDGLMATRQRSDLPVWRVAAAMNRSAHTQVPACS